MDKTRMGELALISFKEQLRHAGLHREAIFQLRDMSAS
jgi:hypothetical protein